LYRQRTMLSPIFGVVVERARSPGEFIYQENHVLVLAQLDPLYVEVSLPVVMYPELVEGMSALVFPEAPFEQPVEATVSVIDRVVDAASATFGVRLELANPQLEVAGGLRCRVMFGLGRAEVSWPEAEPLPRRPSGR
jgi:membrane fusion protein, multidrug efflux system